MEHGRGLSTGPDQRGGSDGAASEATRPNGASTMELLGAMSIASSIPVTAMDARAGERVDSAESPL